MATPLESWTKTEVRAVIRFLNAKGLNPTKIHIELISVYGENVMKSSQIYDWCQSFKTGRTSLDHAPGSGRPKSSLTEDNIARVDRLIREDRRICIRDLAYELDLSSTTVYRVVHQQLGYVKVSARWVPKLLTGDQKEKRVDACTTMRHCTHQNRPKNGLKHTIGKLCHICRTVQTLHLRISICLVP